MDLMKIFFGEYQSWLARVTNVFLFGSGVCLVWMLAGCAAEPDLVDLKKQVQKLSENQQDFQKHNQHLLERVETIESKVDEHDFLVGELITTEEEASLDTRHLLEKLERTSSRLGAQIDQTRSSTQRRDRDLSIRVKALDARLENLVHEKNPGKSKPVKNRTRPPVPRISDSESDQDIQQPPKVSNQIAGTQAAAFRSAYKVYLNGRYDRAVVEFQRFLRNFPNGALTPQAYYYLGDSHYIQKDYDGAAQSFRHFITNYPDNQYTPPALFKLGLIMMETHQIPQAQKFLNQVIQKYPDVQEANLAKVQLTNIQNAE